MMIKTVKRYDLFSRGNYLKTFETMADVKKYLKEKYDGLTQHEMEKKKFSVLNSTYFNFS